MKRSRKREYHPHGLYAVARQLDSEGIPLPSTPLGRALREWRDAIVRDLGGEDAISTQQAALVDVLVRTKLLVDSVDAYVLSMPSPVNKQKRALFACVVQRQALVGQLQSLLRDLGLERRVKPLPDLHTYLQTKQEPS